MDSLEHAEDEQAPPKNPHYIIPTSLVSKLIIAIFGSLIGIGGYMVVWAINDGRWKTIIDERMASTQSTLKILQAAVYPNQILAAETRIRLEQIEREIESLKRLVEDNRRRARNKVQK